VIQHLIAQERTITELARRMEITQQAVSKLVAQMVHLGIVESVPAEDRRARTIRLSERGWQSVKLARQARRKIESRLLKTLGSSRYHAAREILLESLRELGGLRRIGARRVREPR